MCDTKIWLDVAEFLYVFASTVHFEFRKRLVGFGTGTVVLSDSKLKNCSVYRSMNTRNILSA